MTKLSKKKTQFVNMTGAGKIMTEYGRRYDKSNISRVWRPPVQISQTNPTANPFPLPTSGLPGQTKPVMGGENADLGSLGNGNPQQMANLVSNTGDGMQGPSETQLENGGIPQGGMPNLEAWNDPSGGGVDARGTNSNFAPQAQRNLQPQQPQQLQGLMNGNRGNLGGKQLPLGKNGLNGNSQSVGSDTQRGSQFGDRSSSTSQPSIPSTSNASFNATPTSVSDNDVSLNVRKDESGRQRLQDSSSKQGQNYELANKNALSNMQTGQQMGEQANQHGQAQHGLQDLAGKNTADGLQNMDMAKMNNQAGQQAGQMAGIQQLMAQAMQMVQQVEKMKFAQGKAVEQGGKATEAQGKGIETMGQGTEANGHATEKTGHATEATGVGMQTTATGMLASGAAAAASVFGAPAGAALLAAGTALMGMGTATVANGIGLQGTGLGLQATGKGQQAAGQQTQQVGKQTQQTGQKQQNEAKTAEQKAKEEEEKKKAEAEKLMQEMKKLLEQAQQNQNQAGQNFGDANKNAGLANQQGNLRNQAGEKAKLANQAAKLDRDLAKKAKNNREVVDNALDKVFGETAKNRNGAGNEAGQIQPAAQNNGEFGDASKGTQMGDGSNGNGKGQSQAVNPLNNRKAPNRAMNLLANRNTNRNTLDPRKNANAQGQQGATAARKDNGFGAQAGDAANTNANANANPNFVNPMAASQGQTGNQGQGGQHNGGQGQQQVAAVSAGNGQASPARGASADSAAANRGGSTQSAPAQNSNPQAQSFSGLSANPGQGFGDAFNPSGNTGSNTAFNRGVDLNGQANNKNAAMSKANQQQPKAAFLTNNKGAKNGQGEGQGNFAENNGNGLNAGLQGTNHDQRAEESSGDDNSSQKGNARFEESNDSVTVNLNDLSASSGAGSQTSSGGGSKNESNDAGAGIGGIDGLGGNGAGTDSDGPIGGSAQLFGSKKEMPNFNTGLNGIGGLNGLGGSGNALPASSSSNTPSSLNLN